MPKSPSSASDARATDSLDLRDLLLSTLEQSLSAQAAAVRRLRAAPARGLGSAAALHTPRVKGRSQVDLAADILKAAASPLHVAEIIARIHKASGRLIDPESLVSALSKRVARKDRFSRTARNTFALLD